MDALVFCIVTSTAARMGSPGADRDHRRDERKLERTLLCERNFYVFPGFFNSHNSVLTVDNKRTLFSQRTCGTTRVS